MTRFVLTLQNNNHKIFRRFYWFVLFVHFFIATMVWKNSPIAWVQTMAAVTLVLLFLILLRSFSGKGKKESPVLYGTSAGILLLFWIFLQAWFPCILLLFIIALVRYIQQQQDIAIFTPAGIEIHTVLLKNKYEWKDCSNVILKDHLLSIDFTSNRLLQLPIDPVSFSTNQQQCNQFCTDNLTFQEQSSNSR